HRRVRRKAVGDRRRAVGVAVAVHWLAGRGRGRAHPRGGMMARVRYVRDSRGIEQVLRSAGFARAVRAEAEAIAAAVRARRPGVDVVVDTYDGGDRAAASVTVRDRRALGWQATDGDLTRAAAARGLEVRERSR